MLADQGIRSGEMVDQLIRYALGEFTWNCAIHNRKVNSRCVSRHKNRVVSGTRAFAEATNFAQLPNLTVKRSAKIGSMSVGLS
jgi:hypothetical protein